MPAGTCAKNIRCVNGYDFSEARRFQLPLLLSFIPAPADARMERFVIGGAVPIASEI